MARKPALKPFLPATIPPRSAAFQAFLEKNDLEKNCVEKPGAQSRSTK